MTGRFDEIIHAPNRLRICAMLAPATELLSAALRRIKAFLAALLSFALVIARKNT